MVSSEMSIMLLVLLGLDRKFFNRKDVRISLTLSFQKNIYRLFLKYKHNSMVNPQEPASRENLKTPDLYISRKFYLNYNYKI